jgi:hypothetical protein
MASLAISVGLNMTLDIKKNVKMGCAFQTNQLIVRGANVALLINVQKEDPEKEAAPVGDA